MAAVLTVEPGRALVDVPRRITLSGVPPGARVALAARTPRGGAVWEAGAAYRADATGRLDLARDAPISGRHGSYAEASAMGLIWSQVGEGDLFHPDVARPLETTITALVDDAPVASAALVQDLAAEGVARVPVAEDGLVGTLFRPPGEGPHPAILILNGSGGGINEPRAALWASRGVAALALGYFGAPGLPRYLTNTALETFARALDWLRAAVRPRGGFVAVAGQSRGGELALLLGATFPERVSAVLATVPSAFVHGGQAAADPAHGRDGPSWTLAGEPLAHQWQDNAAASWATFDAPDGRGRNADAMLTALGDPAAMRRARIPVERIAGPVLLLSGGDDGAWPSALYCLVVQSSLLAAGHPHEVLWRNWPGAGHAILFPHVPATGIDRRHPVTGRLSVSGGMPAANARADREAWEVALAFVRRHA